MTEVASFVIYYHNEQGFLYRDIAFQFHPELIGLDSVRGVYNPSDIKLNTVNDGLKILIAFLFAGFEKFRIPAISVLK